MKQTKARLIFTWMLLILLAIIFLIPFALMILGSFSSTQTLIMRKNFWLPQEFYLGNYVSLFTSSNFMRWLTNSLIMTVIPVVCGILINSMLGYIFAKKEFKGRNFIFGMFIAMIMIPAQMTLVPNYLMYGKFGFLNNYSAILVPGIWSISNMFLVKQYMMTVPDSIIEAAAIDGSGDFRTFFKIVFPMCKTPIAVMAIFSFLGYWNNFMPILIYMNDSKMYNLTVGLATMVQKDGNYGAQMVGAVVTLAPVFALYISCQKYFIEGISLSGIKG